MSEENIKKKTIEDKLTTIKYNCSSKPHLTVDEQKCRNCEKRYCTYICPAGVYTYDENSNTVNVEYENCLECGACRIACPYGAIEWNYPEAGCGVIYKQS